jgi:methionine-rich copper-binding protein CopC
VRSLVRAVVTLALVVAVQALLVLAGGPASAHAQLIGSTPTDGASVPVAPAVVTLTFSDPIDAGFVKVLVSTPASTTTPSATSAGSVVSIPLTPAGPGAYRVIYRVVSADGHPVSGELRFTVPGTPTASPSATASSAAAAPSSTATPSSTAPGPAPTAPAAAVAGSHDPAGSSGWLVGAAIVVAIAAGLAAVLLARRPGRER